MTFIQKWQSFINKTFIYKKRTFIHRGRIVGLLGFVLHGNTILVCQIPFVENENCLLISPDHFSNSRNEPAALYEMRHGSPFAFKIVRFKRNSFLHEAWSHMSKGTLISESILSATGKLCPESLLECRGEHTWAAFDFIPPPFYFLPRNTLHCIT